MKKTIILLLSLATTVALQAQLFNVTEVRQLEVPRNEKAINQAVAISPQGDYLLLSSDTKQGLLKWDIETSSATTLTDDDGAGSDVLISEDGQQIVYSQVSYKNNRRHQAVKTINLNNNKKRSLLSATRHLQGYDIDGSTVAIMGDGKLSLHSLQGRQSALSRPVLTHYHLKLYVNHHDETYQLAPNGLDEHYIWGSLSPDGSKVLYYVSGHGAFVCDIDGKNVIAMGNLTAPKWWDNNIIVGMKETDDEYKIIHSSIVARTLDGVEQVLTGEDVVATYPLPSSRSGRIAFSTPDGKVFLMTIK